MTTHYEVLGVRSDAGIDEIRARYRSLARDLHPDRAGSSATDVRMARLNEAWAVLRDPQRRQAYDRDLAGGSTTEVGSEFDAPPSAPRRDPSDPPHVPTSAPVGCLAAAAGVVPWVALLMVLGAIFVFTAYAGSGRDDDPSASDGGPAMVQVRDLRGSCIQLINGAVVPVDCLMRPHEGRIVAQASRDAECPEGTDTWVVRQQDVLACTEPGTAVTTVE
ncbi:MAG: J domain-containing protein [Acidimicrobiales bacterium]